MEKRISKADLHKMEARINRELDNRSTKRVLIRNGYGLWGLSQSMASEPTHEIRELTGLMPARDLNLYMRGMLDALEDLGLSQGRPN